ncbi:hypothetical protein [Crocosphaera sp. XPORK-15E]|uniref:hypothetical protein n=1 Tax=Crocosphaera sp. XPORK-15E TaxID=3110247 RepID=UPI002B1ED41A|nr:hypothetical protein [Crocosphaera sp. XPORK-15E]MEA5533112.1 hypothetical protein [Crocosphaera sp. XPORK-15E]
MSTATLLPNTPDVSADDYCVFGLATCFLKEDGEFHQVRVIEPIPSAALEAIFKGITTSYELACAKSLGEILGHESLMKPAEFPEDAQFCDDFTERTIAAVRTYQNRLEAKSLMPLGTIKNDFNFSLEKKRILNAVNVVKTEDNVKQHSHTHKVL